MDSMGGLKFKLSDPIFSGMAANRTHYIAALRSTLMTLSDHVDVSDTPGFNVCSHRRMVLGSMQKRRAFSSSHSFEKEYRSARPTG